MKLLDKRKIASDSAAQKKAQIDEGVEIARKVDLLREELVSLEKQRATFLSGSQLELKKAIGALELRKADIEGEIRMAEERLVELRKPLDDEWAKLGEDKTQLAKAWENYEVSNHELSQKEKGITEAEKRIAEEAKRIEETGRDTRLLNREAQTLHSEAEQLTRKLRGDSEEHTRASTEENRNIARIKAETELVAKATQRAKEAQDVREKKLDERQKLIADRYQALMKTIKSLKKK